MGNGSAKSEDASWPIHGGGIQLRCVVVFFRHGPRTPLTHIKAFDDICYDPSRPEVFPPHMNIPTEVISLDGTPFPSQSPHESTLQLLPPGMTAGMLTSSGKKQAFNFGRSLRSRYMEQLGMTLNRFTPHEIFVRAKNLQRTVGTAQSVLAGMYGRPAFHGTTAFIRVADLDKDILHAKHSGGRTPPPEATSHPFTQLTNNQATRDARTNQVNHFEVLAIPHFTSSAGGNEFPAHQSRSSQQKPEVEMTLNPLFSETLRCLQCHLNTPQSPKMYLFCCSDTTIHPMLEALGCRRARMPRFLADLAFELYQDQNSAFWVRIVYKGKPHVVQGLRDAFVPFESFQRVIDPFAPVQLGQYVTKCWYGRNPLPAEVTQPCNRHSLY